MYSFPYIVRDIIIIKFIYIFYIFLFGHMRISIETLHLVIWVNELYIVNTLISKLISTRLLALRTLFDIYKFEQFY